MNNLDQEQQSFVDVIAYQRNYFANESARVQAQLIVMSKKCDDISAELQTLKDKLTAAE